MVCSYPYSLALCYGLFCFSLTSFLYHSLIFSHLKWQHEIVLGRDDVRALEQQLEVGAREALESFGCEPEGMANCLSVTPMSLNGSSITIPPCPSRRRKIHCFISMPYLLFSDFKWQREVVLRRDYVRELEQQLDVGEREALERVRCAPEGRVARGDSSRKIGRGTRKK